MFRTVPKSLHGLYLLIMSALFHNHICRDWVREFTCTLALNAPLVRRSRGKDGKEAARCIAWHLGQLVRDPEAFRKEELIERHRRKHHGVARRDDHEPIEALVDDVKNINILAFRLLVEFGVLQQVRDAFPLMHRSEDPLFTPEAWPSWWRWAALYFFRQPLDIQPKLES